MSSVVHIRPPVPHRADEVRDERPDTPAIGRWYWVKKYAVGEEVTKPNERRLACVTHLGSNYVQVTYVESHTTQRIHNDHFWERCEFVEDPNALLLGNADRCKRELDGLLEDVKQLTIKLGVAPSLSLGAGAVEAAATTLVARSDRAGAEYKTALVKAKEETLPALFEQIKEKSAEYGQWLSAQIIPMSEFSRSRRGGRGRP